MGIAVKDPLEIYFNGGKIILSKYEPTCVFCGSADKVSYYKNKIICADCLGGIKEKSKVLIPAD